MNGTRRSIAFNSLSMLSGQLVGKGAIFLSLMLLSRYLADEFFGMTVFAVSLSMILMFVIDMGVSIVANRKFSVDPSHLQQVFSTALGLRVITTAIGFALLMTVVLLSYSPVQVLITGLIGAGFVLDSWGEIIFSMFRGRERMGLEARSRIAGAATSVLSVLLVIGLDLGPFMAAVTYIVRATVLLTVAWSGLRRFGIRMTPVFDGPGMNRLFRESWSLGAMGLLFIAFQRLDNVIILGYLGINAVGAYSESYRILESLVLVVTPTLLPGALFPSLCRAFRDGWAGFSDRMQRIAGLVTGLAGLVMIPFLAGGIRILELVWGGSFQRGQGRTEVQLVFLLLIAFTPVLYWMNYLVAGVIAAGRQRITIAVTAVSLGVSLAGNLILVPAVGLVGAAVMVGASNTLMAVLYFIVLRRIGPIPLYRGFWKPLTAIAGAVPVLLLTSGIESTFTRVLLPTAAFILLWLPLGGLKLIGELTKRSS